MALKRHLSEVSHPSGDFIGWSPVRPLQDIPGFTSPGTFRPRAFSAPRRLAPPPTRLPCFMQAPPMGFREPDLHPSVGISAGGWRGLAVPELNGSVAEAQLQCQEISAGEWTEAAPPTGTGRDTAQARNAYRQVR